MPIEDFLDQVADVLLETFESDAYGEQAATETVEATAVPCLVRPLSAELLAQQGRDASKRMARIYFAERPFPEADARQRLIRVGDDTYRPVDAHDQNSMGRLWQVDCELVTS